MVLGLAGAGRAATEKAPPRPSIVFILLDDFGRDHISAYGSETPTPNVDRLADQGVRFETAWSQPTCTPTRVAFMTGMYPYRSGWTTHHDVPQWGGKGLDSTVFTGIGQVLKQAGYATAVAGKWQINDLRPDRNLMKKHGFDEYCPWPGVESDNKELARHRYWDPFLDFNGTREQHPGLRASTRFPACSRHATVRG